MKPQATDGEPVELRTVDGTDLQGVLYRPKGQHRRAVLVAGGLGIPQRFYAPFATWLAQRGMRPAIPPLPAAAQRTRVHLNGVDTCPLVFGFDQVAAGRQLYGSSSSIRLAGCVGSRSVSVR